MGTYKSTKIIDGFSTVFRQWRADSHCNQLHGYALKFKVIFEAKDLDSNNWVQDFGFLKNPKYVFDGMQIGDWFKYMFDHTLIISRDDPNQKIIKELGNLQIANIRNLDRVGCEAFAELVFVVMNLVINSDRNSKGRVQVFSVECIENEKNSAIYERK